MEKETILFRVLSEEEAEKVTRWKAPELNGTPLNLAKTKAWTSPIMTSVDKPVRPAVGESLQSVSTAQSSVTAPAVLAASRDLSSTVSGLAVANPSVDIVQTSYDDGYAKGYSEGNAAIHQQAVKELSVVIDAIRQSSVNASEISLHKEVVGLSIDIARLLLSREIQIDSDAMLQLAKAGLEQLPAMGTGSRRIHLHPLDANVVREVIVDLSDVQVVDDLEMKRGDCRITTNISTLECGLDQWLDGVARQLGIISDTATADTIDQEADKKQ